MQEESKNYTEEWTVVINKMKYILSEERARVVQNLIEKGKGGMVRFDDFYINIAFIQEFYLSKKIYDKNLQLESLEDKPISEEERARVREKIEKFKKNFFKKGASK